MLTWLLVFGGGAAVLAVRSNYSRIVLEWNRFLTPFGESALAALTERLRSDREVLDITYRHARELTIERGLKTILQAGHSLVTQFGRERLRLLDSMRTYSKTATQIESLPALWPIRFHLPMLAVLAGLITLADVFLVGSPERFRLRILLLRRAVGHVMRATRRVAEGKAGLATLDAALADWGTIDREVAASFHAVATAILKPPVAPARATARRR